MSDVQPARSVPDRTVTRQPPAMSFEIVSHEGSPEDNIGPTIAQVCGGRS